VQAIGADRLYSRPRLPQDQEHRGRSGDAGTMPISEEHYRQMDATALAQAIRQGETNATDVLALAAELIDAWQPRINAITWLDLDSARRQIRKLDPDAPFAGVPMLLKDIQPHNFMGMPTSDGCAAHRERLCNQHSHLVARLVTAGFIILGKTSTPEFGLKAITEPDAFGPTLNPWHPDFTTGGSSGGSAAAVAAGLVPLASASDGGGSIRIPAAYCGLYGLKPGRARVSAGPDQGPGWDGLTCDHVLTRSVRDSAALLDILAGPEDADPYACRVSPADPAGNSFSTALDTAPRPLRIALWSQSPLGGPVDDSHLEALNQTVAQLRELGHAVIPAAPRYDARALAHCYLMVYAGHMAAELAAIEAEHGPGGLRQVELDTRVLASLGNSYSAGDYVRAGRLWQQFNLALAELMTEFDLVLSPTTAQPPAKIGEQALPWIEAAGARFTLGMKLSAMLRSTGLVEKMALQQLARVPFTQLANFTGVPAASIPAGRCLSGQLPVGVQLMARPGAEATLLQISHQLERTRPWRVVAPTWS